MTVLNYTPHTVTLDGVEYPPSGWILRIHERTVVRYPLVTAHRHILRYAEAERLFAAELGNEANETPFDPIKGVTYIVSRPVAMVAKLPCIVAPDELVRDEEGRVVGAKGLVTFASL